MSTHTNLNLLLGKFREPEHVMAAINKLQAEGLKVYDVYSPYPIHGVDKMLGIKRSRLTVAAFLYGCTGFILAVLMQLYMMVWDWPMDIGGKPHFAAASFIPVTFELMVLCTAFGLVFTFFAVSKMFPGKKAVSLDPRVTDDVFVVAMDESKMSEEEKGTAQRLMTEGNAFEVTTIEIDDEFFEV